MQQTDPPSHVRRLRYCLTTKEFATQYHTKELIVRKQYVSSGAYCGIRPLVLPSRRLLRPDGTIEKLVVQKLGGAA